ARRMTERMPTFDVIRTFPSDYRVIFVGDAAMSPYEIVQPGGSVEHWNEESGETWLRRMLNHFPHAVWLNPVKRQHWDYTHSTQMMRQLFGNRMFPLTLEGIDEAMKELVR
ncbi:MAG: VWA domain-containing protein, partial [Beijerinckiaceae bacterium]